jgi:hypothetical protein
VHPLLSQGTTLVTSVYNNPWPHQVRFSSSEESRLHQQGLLQLQPSNIFSSPVALVKPVAGSLTQGQ